MSTCGCQSLLDTRDVYYKSCPDDIDSGLEALGITVNSSLEDILQIFGLKIINQEYISIPTIVGQPTIKTFEDVVNYLIQLNNDRLTQILSLQTQVTNITTLYQSLDNRIKAIEKPNIVDTNAIGFTNTSTIQTILQLFSNNI